MPMTEADVYLCDNSNWCDKPIPLGISYTNLLGKHFCCPECLNWGIMSKSQRSAYDNDFHKYLNQHGQPERSDRP